LSDAGVAELTAQAAAKVLIKEVLSSCFYYSPF